ncbi:ribonuclease R [Pseudobdellovibrio exovorus JSS]|uniref:Ribonuclease R n=2 Tax=Pseudobdellovibrio exovorus TaxID=453816 RepID=M4VNN8_9BACT|nr:ribonuclease R [Pseudobdellovibrio exovorus JSS]
MLEGLIKRHPDGFGFFIPDDKEIPDVYVPQHAMKSAMTNDRATITVEKERDGRLRGEIIRITERAQKRVAGKFTRVSDNWGIIKDEGRGWGKDLRIPLDKSKNAKDGELVEAQITQFPDEGNFEGEVLSIIGDASDPLNDIKRIVIGSNIPEHFSKETLAEASVFDKNPSEKDFKGRKDLRDLPIITIDGATAKDFDDAVFVEMTDRGFHLYVAIADVSHYVKVGSSMDKEAYERGTSVYFPNFVIPMLPEGLSNGLCSLNPHVPRLALVADMHFDFTGEMTASTFYEGVIESKARVTYGEAQELIDGSEIEKLDHVKSTIFHCADLAKVLMAKRFKEGSLDLEVPETELVIDGAGNPVDVIRSERLFAHRLIEELMLAANVAVAKFLAKQEIPAFYRVHEVPDGEKISNLQKYMENLGYKAQLEGGKLQKRLTRALQEFSGKPESQIIHILTLRSMSQAKYTPNNLGHFGLGFDFYTHFTSPIRRYPDLIVHRLLKNRILKNSSYNLMSEEDLTTAGTWLSACEQRSAKAERQIQAIKKARFMQNLIGESFEGLISSVTKFGVFVLLREFNIDGLIRLDDLGSDKWEFDEETLTLIAKRSGFKYQMGDTIRVTVSMVDIEQGQINFVREKSASESTAKAHSSTKGSHKAKSKGFDKRSESKGEKFSGGRGKKDKYSFKEKGARKSGAPEAKKGKKKYSDESYESRPQRSARHQHSEKSYQKDPYQKPESENKSATSQIRSISSLVKNFTERSNSSSSERSESGRDYTPKPRYASLSDYLDQRKKGPNDEAKSESKPAFRSTENRKNSEKRRSSENDSGGVRKARSQKSGRGHKSR